MKSLTQQTSVLTWLALFGLLGTSMVFAQEEKPKEEKIPVEMTKPLLERQPYDLVLVDTAKDGKPVRIKPQVFPGGRPPSGTPTGNLTIELVDVPGRQFAISWRNVKRYQQFPQLLLDEARSQLQAKDFDLSFRYLQRLKNEYANYPGIDAILEELLVQNALERFQSGALDEALGMLEEARRKYPNRRNLDTSIQSVGQRLVQGQIDAENWESARQLIDRFEKLYGKAFEESINKWRAEIAQRAESEMKIARQQIQQKDYRSALSATEMALSIDPEIPNGKEQLNELIRRYPQVRIATLAPGEATPPHSTLTLSGRRNKRLIYRDLSEIVGYGPEGGEYISPFGTMLRPTDRFEMTVVMRDRLTPVTGFDLSRQLQDPASQNDPIVARLTPLIEDLAVREVRQVDLRLRLPHVRPEALFGFVPRKGDVSKFPVPQNGPFREATFQDEGHAFVPAEDFKASAKLPPSEIQMLPFASSADAMSALNAGEVHMVDRLDPATAKQLLVETPDDLVVDHYRAPTMHILVPNLDNPYLQNRDFRRGVLYGINRQDILHSRLLAGEDLEGCAVVSAPIPVGMNLEDPVAYGYDPSIEPREYAPQMSIALRAIASGEMRKQAEELKQALIPLDKLVIGHPNSEISSQTCLSIAQYLKRIGLPCELKVVSPEITSPAEAGVDLLYAEIQIAEPLIDVPRMFDQYVPLVHQRQYFQLALRQLGESQSWQEVRERFWSLHRLAHDDLLILPLFQTQDYFVYRRSLGGVGYQPISLFQQVERWDVAPALDVVKN
ncbi:ABC transporter substrate-binding protein [Bremerella sp. JC817]|uniref:ABC transporter substrate-binding protein n=1 Tax=Bremerella sp. JC817 TaxID=3231756 RepID=UPI003458B98E